MPDAPLITDAAPRDGLQNDPTILEPAVRAELCRRLVATGMPRVEAVSFVHPKYVPAMAGAEEVMEDLHAVDGWEERFSGLALNERGLQRALDTGLRQVNTTVAVTDTFSQRNQGAGREEMTEALARTLATAREAGIRRTVTLSVCFGCPFEGRVAPSQTLSVLERVVTMEPDEVFLADTIGVAAPPAVSSLISQATRFGIPVGGHFHDTRGTGIANSWAALEAGAALLDASVGGVGGCPFAPGATGNIATEDLVYMLEESGVPTGIDLDALIETSHWLSEQLGHSVPGAVSRAGGFPTAAA